MACAFADPREWLLKISPKVQAQSRQQSQVYATPSSRWCAYINQICLHAFLDWISTESFAEVNVWYSYPGSNTAFWEFVNGTAILLEGKQVVLIPSEAIDDSELEVPQEWVDIPSWAADYYLAVQVKPDGEWVRIWAYTTHTELKSLADYDPVDRTYCMDARHLTQDLNAFSLSYQFCRGEETKAPTDPLPQLSTEQADNLLQRLDTDSVTFPRLSVPFTTWGALLENEQWRQRLCQQRQQTQSSQVQVNLSRWLEGVYDTAWETIETLLKLNSNALAFNFRSSSGIGVARVKRAKLIDLGIEIESQKVVLLVALIPENNQQVSIRVQLHPVSEKFYLPDNIKIALLLESGEIIQEIQAREQDNYVQLKLFSGEVGECFSIQVTLNNYQITENFVI
ncbi:hypothetical protein WA1_20675 [Scytonema hofmannii PCC 7110]|uniref:DUF1822 domain-containing protein n=1 Tax=Scytonema hofmannii PCC 7110 TaxID=128403 RepID=A0A139XCI2_9CYAN|nr:DUF1822 family protein [Scytonema hofmannii]KYC42385.1 hypothetical protein WA1_20675 [Scytonema hofmannii PCC 7110]